MNNKILDGINEEIARINRALEMVNASKGKDASDEQNRVKTRNLLTVTKQNLEALAKSISKPRLVKKMTKSATNKQDTKSNDTKLGK